MNFLKDGLQQGALIGLAGLIAGVITGWVGVLAGDDVAVLAARGAGWVWLLVGLFPVALIGSAAVFGAGPERPVTLAQNALAGFLGGLLGLALFIVGAVQIPAVFGSAESPALMTALRGGIGVLQVAVVVVVTLLAGLLVGAVQPLKKG